MSLKGIKQSNQKKSTNAPTSPKRRGRPPKRLLTQEASLAIVNGWINSVYDQIVEALEPIEDVTERAQKLSDITTRIIANKRALGFKPSETNIKADVNRILTTNFQGDTEEVHNCVTALVNLIYSKSTQENAVNHFCQYVSNQAGTKTPLQAITNTPAITQEMQSNILVWIDAVLKEKVAAIKTSKAKKSDSDTENDDSEVEIEETTRITVNPSSSSSMVPSTVSSSSSSSSSSTASRTLASTASSSSSSDLDSFYAWSLQEEMYSSAPLSTSSTIGSRTTTTSNSTVRPPLPARPAERLIGDVDEVSEEDNLAIARAMQAEFNQQPPARRQTAPTMTTTSSSSSSSSYSSSSSGFNQNYANDLDRAIQESILFASRHSTPAFDNKKKEEKKKEEKSTKSKKKRKVEKIEEPKTQSKKKKKNVKR